MIFQSISNQKMKIINAPEYSKEWFLDLLLIFMYLLTVALRQNIKYYTLACALVGGGCKLPLLQESIYIYINYNN